MVLTEVVFFFFAGGGEALDDLLLGSSTLFLFLVTPFFKEEVLSEDEIVGNWEDRFPFPSSSLKYFFASLILSGSCQNGIKFGIDDENS